MTDDCSDSYAEARAKFLDLARAKQAKVHSVIHPGLGVDNEELAMDFAVFGDPQAKKTLLLVSGTHGQEGYIGSAIQIAFLRDLVLPDGVNVVALHALNPWGFSHLSRSDELNIDCNRNFLDFSQPLPANPLYVAAHEKICPDDWTEDRPSAIEISLAIATEHGPQALLDALTGGQFEVATGLNFGGRAPSWSNRMVRDHLPPLLAHAEKIAFVEWHTGLGGFGELCHICMHDPDSDAFARVWDWMGEEAKATFAASFGVGGSTPSYSGLFSTWLPSAAPRADWTGVVIEVGTYDPGATWDGLRRDRWLKFGRGRSSQPRDEIRREMLEMLYPASPEWRRKGVEAGCDAQRRALDGLVRW